MNIVYHHRTQGLGAEGVHIREIILGLRQLNHLVYLVSPPGVDINIADPVDTTRKTILLANVLKFIAKICPQLIFELFEIGYNFIGLINLLKVLLFRKIDFIYERNAFYCWVGVYLANRFRIPVILEVNEVSGVERVRGQILTSLARLIERYNFRNASAIIVVSEFLKNHIVVSFNIDSRKIFVIPNAVNINEFDVNSQTSDIRLSLHVNKTDCVIGFVGGFVKWHNFKLLLDVIAQIITDNKYCVRLLLIGDGPLRVDIMQMVYERHLNEYVLLTGRIAHKFIPAYINAMDICIIPHSNEYRSPIKLFEYMAMAKPVIAPNLPPIEAIITQDVNGKLFKVADPVSLKSCIIDLVADKDKRDRIGQAAREDVISKHLWVHNAQRVVNIVGTIKK